MNMSWLQLKRVILFWLCFTMMMDTERMKKEEQDLKVAAMERM